MTARHLQATRYATTLPFCSSSYSQQFTNCRRLQFSEGFKSKTRIELWHLQDIFVFLIDLLSIDFHIKGILFWAKRLELSSAQNYSAQLGLFFRWNISVICLTVVLKLAIAVFISLYFQTFWPNWLNFVRPFQNIFGLWRKNTQVLRHSLLQSEKSRHQTTLLMQFILKNACETLRVHTSETTVTHPFTGNAASGQ